jgi:hypothetical protein
MKLTLRGRRRATAAMSLIGVLALVGTTFTGTAAATGDRDGDADRHRATAYTEDDDRNDGGTRNNVADDGDNRHPSGRDRSVEHGRSGNQGRAESDPDDDGRGPDRSNGGPDKPDGTGGIDKADQDGNNGCGNDDDFEDDNEGWCGRKHHHQGRHHHHDEDDHDDQPAKPAVARSLTVEAECFKVSVASSHDIDWVKVLFQDGSWEKFRDVTGTAWSKTFTKAVAKGWASAAGMEDKDHVSSDCVAATSTSCPAGVVDMNGAEAGGCVAPATAEGPCPVGMVDVDGAHVSGGCVAPGTGTVPCPVGMVDVNGAGESGGCLTPEALGVASTAVPADVLSNSLTAPAPATARPVPAGVLSNSLTAPASAELATSASPVRPAVAAVDAGSTAGAGALAFTGRTMATMLLIALMLLAVSWAVLSVSRGRPI